MQSMVDGVARKGFWILNYAYKYAHITAEAASGLVTGLVPGDVRSPASFV